MSLTRYTPWSLATRWKAGSWLQIELGATDRILAVMMDLDEAKRILAALALEASSTS